MQNENIASLRRMVYDLQTERNAYTGQMSTMATIAQTSIGVDMEYFNFVKRELVELNMRIAKHLADLEEAERQFRLG